MSRKAGSDVDSVFTDDYLYFFSDRLTDKHSEAEVKTIARLLKLEPGAEIADIGCGHGRISNRLSRDGMSVSALDSSPDFLEIARSQATQWSLDISYQLGDMRQLPWSDASFDAAISWLDSFGYFSDDDNIKVLSECFRVLRPEGQLLIDTMNREFIVRELQPVSFKERGDDFLIDRFQFDSTTGRLRTHRISVRAGIVTRASHFWRLYTFTELRAILATVGFADCDVHGSEGEPFSVTSPRMHVVATRGSHRRCEAQ